MRKLCRESWTFYHHSETIRGHHSNSNCHWFGTATTEAPGFDFHMFISILSVTTSRFPATWGFSHIKPPWCNSPWRYMTNCFTNVLPRRLFRFVTDKLPLSTEGSDSALPLDDHGWQLIMAHKFCFPHCSQFWQGWMSQQGMEDKWWQILSRTLNIL